MTEAAPVVSLDKSILQSNEAGAEVQAIIAASDTSSWLKSALESALARDPVDAVNDAEVLHGLLSRRLDSLLQDKRSSQTKSASGQSEHAARLVKILTYKSTVALALDGAFDKTVAAVIMVSDSEIEPDTIPRLQAVLGVDAPFEFSNEFLDSRFYCAGYSDVDAARADMDKWDSEGVFSKEDIIDLWVRDTDGEFVFLEQY